MDGLAFFPIAENADDVGAGFGIRRHAAIAVHGFRTGVVSSEGKQDLIRGGLKTGQQVAEIADTAIGILSRVERVDAQLARGIRHQLHKTYGSFGRNCAGAHGGFRFHDAGHKFRRQGVSPGGAEGKFSRGTGYYHQHGLVGWRLDGRWQGDDCGWRRKRGLARFVRVVFETVHGAGGKLNYAVANVQPNRVRQHIMAIGVEAEAIGQHGILTRREAGDSQSSTDNEGDDPQTDMTNLPAATCRSQEPAAELAAGLGQAEPGRALDIAAGRGRHALWLAQRGWVVTAVDRAAGPEAPGVTWLARDLEVSGLEIPHSEYDAIICWLYWQADLLPGVERGVRPGGVVALAGKTAGRFATSLAAYRQAFPGWEEIAAGEDEFKAWLIARKPLA